MKNRIGGIVGMAALSASLFATGAAMGQDATTSGTVSMPGHSAHGKMQQAMQKMQSEMQSAPMSGNPDHDFAAMMIPHHQGAIDMAKAELIYGHDPVLRRLAEEITVEQQQEIELMQRNLNGRPALRP